MNNKDIPSIQFLIAALCENIAYIDLIYNDSDLTEESKTDTVYRITNKIINQALELQNKIVKPLWNLWQILPRQHMKTKTT